MKKLVLLKSVLVVIVFMFTIQLTMAGVRDPKKTHDMNVIMKKHVVYPAYAQENNLTGFVVVAFEVDNKGKIIITQINSDQQYLLEYVKNELQKLVLKNPENYRTSTLYYRFDFKLMND
jgi:hypothetical protein